MRSRWIPGLGSGKPKNTTSRSSSTWTGSSPSAIRSSSVSRGNRSSSDWAEGNPATAFPGVSRRRRSRWRKGPTCSAFTMSARRSGPCGLPTPCFAVKALTIEAIRTVMVTRKAIASILGDYGDIVIATVCSHSSLQIFHGARQEGFQTLGIAIGKRPRFYDAFPLAKPDDFLIVDSYADIVDQADDLVAKQVVTVPHGSFVEYMGSEVFAKLPIPTFGNREVLKWESDREKQRVWLTSAGVPMPMKIERPQDIDRPVFVKYYGAKGGRGSFIAKNHEDFKESIQPGMKYAIQEYVVGTRYYMHYFYSPLATSGYALSRGSLEMLGVDRRDEANIDEMYKLGAQEALRKMGLLPTFVVTGNMPVVLRESLLPKAFEMGEQVVERSMELFGGMVGPFCLETIVTDKLEFKVFEISTRIVAGTNLFIAGSPYSDLTEPGMSTGRRIAREIRIGQKQGRLADILS